MCPLVWTEVPSLSTEEYVDKVKSRDIILAVHLSCICTSTTMALYLQLARVAFALSLQRSIQLALGLY